MDITNENRNIRNNLENHLTEYKCELCDCWFEEDEVIDQQDGTFVCVDCDENEDNVIREYEDYDYDENQDDN
jgi:hypothetical protein